MKRLSASARLRSTALLIFAVTGGAWAWTIQLWASWALGEPACLLQRGAFSVLGLGTTALWVLVGLATGVVAVVAAVLAYRHSRPLRPGDDGEPVQPDRPQRFLAYVGLVLNVLFALTILMGTTAPLFLQPCI